MIWKAWCCACYYIEQTLIGTDQEKGILRLYKSWMVVLVHAAIIAREWEFPAVVGLW